MGDFASSILLSVDCLAEEATLRLMLMCFTAGLYIFLSVAAIEEREVLTYVKGAFPLYSLYGTDLKAKFGTCFI